MSAKRINTTAFTAALAEAELAGLPFSFGSNGTFTYGEDITPEQQAAIEAVYAAHDPDAAELQQAASDALGAIDGKASSTRLLFITSGAGQSATYIIKEQQSREYKAAGYTGDVPLLVQAEADATGGTPQEAADSIIAKADEWITAASEIERARRSGKIAVQSAATAEEITAALDAALAELHAITP